jgi:hypothetical protein
MLAPALLAVMSVLLAAAPADESATMRTWRDATGQFEVRAEFVEARYDREAKETVVALKRDNGTALSVPLKKLSEEDQRWVQRAAQGRRSAKPAGDGPPAENAPAEKPSPKPPLKKPDGRSPEEAIRQALATPGDYEFVNRPLREVVEVLKDRCHIEVLIARRALDDAGVAAESPVTLKAKKTALGDALRAALKPLNLTCVVRDEVLLITTQEDADSLLEVQVYAVAVPMVRAHPALPPAADFDTLIDRITNGIAPQSWDTVGGPGSCAGLLLNGTPCLVVAQTQQVHVEIARFLAGPGMAAGKKPVVRAAPAERRDPAEEKLRQALAQPAEFAFVETPLADVAAFLAKKYGLPISLDKKALDDVGIGADTPITRNVKGISLRSALRLAIADLGLTWDVRDGGLAITTPETAEARLTDQRYPVNDLVASPAELNELAEAIPSVCAPSVWQAVGGRCTLAPLVEGGAATLAVKANRTTHEELAEVLARLRAVAGTGKPLAPSRTKP